MPTDKSIPRNRDAYPVLTPVTIRYSDQDPMQHINNVAITAYLESGRTGLFNQLFKGELPARGMVLARLTVDYVNEIKFTAGVVEVGGRLTRIGGRSLTTDYAIFQGETCCVVSQSVNVFFDPEKRVSVQPSDTVIAAMERFLATQDGVEA